MSGRKHVFITLGFALSLSLIASAVSVMLVSFYDSRHQFDLLSAVCGDSGAGAGNKTSGFRGAKGICTGKCPGGG